MKMLAQLVAAILLCSTQVNAHGVLVAAKGMNASQGMALGVLDNVPRDCTGRNPCQTDTSIIRTREISSGKAGGCGRTIANGSLDIAKEADIVKSKMGGLPLVAPGSQLTITVHQINADGAGPYLCSLNTSGDGVNWTPLTVTRNVPGVLGNSIAQLTDQPLVVQMPSDLKCTGGDGNMCLVRCNNQAVAGPFGGCVPVEMAGAQARDGANQVNPTPAAPATPTPPAAAKKKAGGAAGIAGLLGGAGNPLAGLLGGAGAAGAAGNPLAGLLGGAGAAGAAGNPLAGLLGAAGAGGAAGNPLAGLMAGAGGQVTGAMKNPVGAVTGQVAGAVDAVGGAMDFATNIVGNVPGGDALKGITNMLPI